MKTKKTFLILLIAVFSALPASAVEPVRGCQALESWVAGLEKLPADYDSFSRLERGERNAVYSRLSSAERAALWQHHWQLALRQDGWTAEQKRFIEEAGQLMSAETFAALVPRQGERYEVTRTAVDAFAERAADVFSKQEAATLFYRLGAASIARAETAAALYCYCNILEQDCGFGFSCDPADCRIRYFGCGIFNEEVCDGVCHQD